MLFSIILFIILVVVLLIFLDLYESYTPHPMLHNTKVMSEAENKAVHIMRDGHIPIKGIEKKVDINTLLHS